MVVTARFQRCPSGSLLDHAVLDVLENVGGDYGKQRLFGAVGWGIGAYVTGLVVAAWGIYWSFWTQLVLWYSSLLVLHRIPPLKYNSVGEADYTPLRNNVEGRGNATRVASFAASAKVLAKEMDVVALLGVVFLMGLMYGVIASFLTLNLYNLSGGDPRIVGIAVMWQTSELPAFFFADILMKRIGTAKVLLLSILGYAARISYYAVMTNAWGGAIPFEVLTRSQTRLGMGGVYAVHILGIYAGMRQHRYGDVNAVQNGLARALGTLVGGFFYERYGPRTMWLVTGLGVPLSLIGLGLFSYLKSTSDVVQDRMPLEEAEIFTPHGANPQPMKSEGYGSCDEQCAN